MRTRSLLVVLAMTVVGCGQYAPEDGVSLDDQHQRVASVSGIGSQRYSLVDDMDEDEAEADRVEAAVAPGSAQHAADPASASAGRIIDQSTTTLGPDHFHCFTAGNCAPPSLSGSSICQKGRDYDVRVTQTHGEVAVLSFHGGDIEPESSELAKDISNHFGWSRYDFAAHPTSTCLAGDIPFSRMHITSTHFDDPVVVDLVGRNSRALAIHGYNPDRGNDRGTICVGGANSGEVARFIAYVNSHKASFTGYRLRAINAAAGEDGGAGADCQGLAGVLSKNIVNQAGGGEGGMQLEMNDGIKADLIDHANARYDSLRSVIFGAIGAAMSK